MVSPAAIARRIFPLVLLALAACGSNNTSTDGTPTNPAPGSIPVISTFTPSVTVTNVGRSVTLSWAVTGASSLVLQPGSFDVTGRTSMAVTLDSTTTYTLTATNSAGTAQATTPVRAFNWTNTFNTLESFVATSGANTVTGYTFIVFDKQGALFARSGGDQSDASIRAIASASKLPSVTAILSLVDSGRLNLDTPVLTYLLANDPTFTWPVDKARITMRMLLAHTSGIVGLNDTQPDCLSQPNGGTLRACAQDVANTALIATPGSTFNYGGADFQVAGYIATLLSGQTWQDFFAARVGTPVGMASFTYGNGTNPRIAGGASTNVADYALFLRMIQNGGQVNPGQANAQTVLSPAMITELKKNQISGLPVAYTPFPADRAQNYPGYGLGVFITAPSLYAGSTGPEFSDPGLFGAIPWLDDGLGYGAVLLVTDTVTTGLNMWDAVRPTVISQYTGN